MIQLLFFGIGELPLWQKALRGLGAVLCHFIYWVISNAFQLFITVSRLNILSSEAIQPIYQRVTMILTIVMTFYITFEFVKYVVQPDAATDKEKGAGNIAFKLIAVILLIAFVPRIFSKAYELQNKLIENQVFSKIILGKKNADFNHFGNNFSANMFSLFIRVDKDTCNTKCDEAQQFINYNLYMLQTEGSLKYLNDSINESEKVKINGDTKPRPVIEFNYFLAIIVGAFIVYILIIYNIEVGTRYVQLLFLQIIAPIAILGYLSPKKDGMFQKWGKQCLTTYLDLFIRISIIYFILLLVQVLGEAYKTHELFAGLEGISPTLQTFSYIVIILGLLVFAQKAPKMLQELFPSSGSAAGIGFGLKPKEMAGVSKLAAKGLGAAGGGAIGLAKGAVSRAANAHKRNKEMEEKLKSENKPYSHKAVREALNQARKDEKAARKNVENARKNYEAGNADRNKAIKTARTKLNEAKESGNADKIKDAQKAYDKALADKKKADKEFTAQTTKYNAARDALAKAENNQYSHTILQGLGAGLSGMATGVITGLGTKKFSDIKNKIGETNKKIETKELARVNWLEEGGGATISGTLSKEVTKIQKKFGIRTESDKIKYDIKQMEAASKKNDSQAALYASLKTTEDACYDRSKSKIVNGEQNIKVTADSLEGDGLLHEIKEFGNIKEGDTTSQVYSKCVSATNSAKAQAEAAQNELTEYRAHAKENAEHERDDQIAKINNSTAEKTEQFELEKNKQLSEINTKGMNQIAAINADSSLSQNEKTRKIEEVKAETRTKAEAVKEYAKTQIGVIESSRSTQISEIEETYNGEHGKISQIEENIKNKEIEVQEKFAASAEAETKLQLALKQLSRFGIDQTIKGDTSDAVLVSKVSGMKQAADNIFRNYESNTYISEALTGDEKLQKEFNENGLQSWKSFDKIQGISTNRSSAIKDENSIIREAIRSINESPVTDAANANANAASGKK